MPKTKSEMEYYERVKTYVNLEGVKTRKDLYIRLSKAKMLGKVRTHKQMNIVSRELDLTLPSKPIPHNTYLEQDFYKGKTKTTRYRDKKTGKFIKKPSEISEGEGNEPYE